MKQEFWNFVKTLIEENPGKAEEMMTENIQAYLDMLSQEKDEKPEVTSNGKVILEYLQKNGVIVGPANVGKQKTLQNKLVFLQKVPLVLYGS